MFPSLIIISSSFIDTTTKHFTEKQEHCTLIYFSIIHKLLVLISMVKQSHIELVPKSNLFPHIVVLPNSNCDTNSKSQKLINTKIQIVINSKSQMVAKLKNLNGDKTQKLKL